jgi:hypothetical protein
MNNPLPPLAAILCVIIAFLSLCLTWVATEYLNLETQNQVTLIRFEGRIKELEIKADNILNKVSISNSTFVDIASTH